QIGGQITDANLPRPTNRRSRQRVAVHFSRGCVVSPREPMNQVGLDVEKQQQIEELLQRIDELVSVPRFEALIAQQMEIAIDLIEFAAVLAHFERMHGER